VTLRCIVVDDEPPARQLLRLMLQEQENVELVAECATGPQAVQGIREHRPDLVFLDIQMPQQDGFQVLQELSPGEFPAVIFVTAYDRYAVKAFELNAIDYLLKPFDEERLSTAIGRARDRLAQRDRVELDRQIAAALSLLRPGEGDRRRLSIKEGDRTYLHRIDDIDWVEADAKYVKIHSGKRTYVMRETMKAMEDRLAGPDFVRVSRSAIVNLDRIREIQPWFNGDYVLILQNGTEVTTTKGYRDELTRLISNQ
jgi:two-component system LytT family response regulator